MLEKKKGLSYSSKMPYRKQEKEEQIKFKVRRKKNNESQRKLKLKAENQLRTSIKTKAGCLKSDKIIKPSASFTKKKNREDTITNIISEIENITTDSIDSKTLIKEYYEHFYAHKLDNLDKPIP